MGNDNEIQKHFFRYKFCHGATGCCPHTLVNNQAMLTAIGKLVRDMSRVAEAGGRTARKASRHPGLRIALAACPNACTEPQTKALGIIAVMIPTGVEQSCDGCGRCEKVCAEEAIRVTNGKARVLPQRCVGCGECIRECPRQAINCGGLQFKILAGGRMGRHPRWAEELCVVDDPDLVSVLQNFFDKILSHAHPGERTANVVERIGVARLRKEIFVDV